MLGAIALIVVVFLVFGGGQYFKEKANTLSISAALSMVSIPERR